MLDRTSYQQPVLARNKTGKQKSARTLYSKQLRNSLYQLYDGKCGICGIELSLDWHADHLLPWMLVQETNVHAMQPTCRKCNLRKGAKLLWEESND